MENLVRKMIHDVRERVVKEVPENGDFKYVWEEFEVPSVYGNPPKNTRCLTDIGLWVHYCLIKGEEKRVLEVRGLDSETCLIASKVLESGTKQACMDMLEDENLMTTIIDIISDFDKELDYEARHRYG